MIEDFDQSITAIVKQDYRTADVFKKYQLSYCCSGAVSLKMACEVKGIDFEILADELQQSTMNLSLPNSLPFQEWRIDFLVDFISNIHHTYIYQAIPSITHSFENFTLSHSSKYPELVPVTEMFLRLTEILQVHNKHEDEIIFPYIKQIDSAYRRKEPYGNLFVRTLRKPLQTVEKEHIQIKNLVYGLKTGTNQFTPPENACLSYKVLFKKLEEVHHNLIQHKFLEHNILFPKAIEIEQKLLQL